MSEKLTHEEIRLSCERMRRCKNNTCEEDYFVGTTEQLLAEVERLENLHDRRPTIDELADATGYGPDHE